jgi:replicative DNA helicase
MNNTFSFDVEFQTKILSAMFMDKIFFLSVIDTLRVEYFTVESLQWVFKVIRDYYKEFKNLPTLDVIKNELHKVTDQATKASLIDRIPRMVKYMDAVDLEYVKNETRFYCKDQAVKISIIEASNKISSVEKFLDFEKIKRDLDHAFMVGEDLSGGYDFVKNIKERYSDKEKRKPISTGFDVIDRLSLGGGLASGELGVVVAGSGIGKSWILTLIGLNAVKNGKNVLHYTFELDENYTSKRYDICLMKMDGKTIEENINDLEVETKKLKGKLFIKHFPARSVTLTGLKANIERNKLLGVKPDLIILDYADLINAGGYSGEKRTALEDLYVDIRSMASELKIPIWTASQSNREGYKGDVVKGDNISESFGKLFTADFVMSFSRSEKDKEEGLGKMHIIKTRFGSDGNTFSTSVDLSRGLIELMDKNINRNIENAIRLNDINKSNNHLNLNKKVDF